MSTPTSRPVTIDVWSDIACPWCWIGKRNLTLALDGLDLETEIQWHAFELDPNAPREAPEPIDYAERLARKYSVPREQAQQMLDRMVDAGRLRGVSIDFDRVRPSNTFDAHRLLAWAGSLGDGSLGSRSQSALKDRLFQAYLGEGRVMADRDTLVELATDIGLDEVEAAAVVDSDRYASEVRRDERTAAERGIRGVPAFVIDERWLLNGAQPPDVIRQALLQAAGREAANEAGSANP